MSTHMQIPTFQRPTLISLSPREHQILLHLVLQIYRDLHIISLRVLIYMRSEFLGRPCIEMLVLPNTQSIHFLKRNQKVKDACAKSQVQLPESKILQFLVTEPYDNVRDGNWKS